MALSKKATSHCLCNSVNVYAFPNYFADAHLLSKYSEGSLSCLRTWDTEEVAF